MMTGVLENITNVREMEQGLNHMILEMEDLSSYILFGDIKEYMNFIGKDIEFSIRKDVVDGIVQEVVNNVAVSSVIQTIDQSLFDDMELDSNMSLITEDSKVIDVVTFNHRLLKKGDQMLSQIILVVANRRGKSTKATWNDMTCLDVNSKAFNLRLFSNYEEADDFAKNAVGSYIMVDIKRTDFGFEVINEVMTYEQEVQVPPEVSVAKFKLSMIAKKDEELWKYIQKHDMLDYLGKLIYFEPGYHLVEMAAEIILIQAIVKIFDGYDRQLLYRAVFTSRGYLIGATSLSNPLVNYHRIITSELKNDATLIKLLDITGGVEEGDINKQAYLSIRRQVTSIMKERRGINEETNINNTLNNIDSEYSGLFQRGLV